jgi:hypothetical protein
MSRHVGWRQKFRIYGSQETLTGYLHCDEHPDGTLAFISIEIHREGTMARAMARSFCAALNIGLDKGVPLADFVQEFKDWRFEPSGPVEGSPNVAACSSLLDYIVRELEATYLQPKPCTCEECP